MHGAGALSTCVLQASMASRFGQGFVLAADIGKLCQVHGSDGTLSDDSEVFVPVKLHCCQSHYAFK